MIILDYNDRERAMDELPQSASGKTIMTSEPKFIPAEAVQITVRDGLDISMVEFFSSDIFDHVEQEIQ